jgi:uncharacterized repeat protein (TIGR03803 family)
MYFSKHAPWAVLALCFLAPAVSSAQTLQTLHNFVGYNNDGAAPIGGLTQVGNALFGVTALGGAKLSGTIFKLRPDANHTYAPLYAFKGGRTDGAGPSGGLISVGATLYGVTAVGGTYDFGTIFSYNAANNQYKVLYNFGGARAGSAPDGARPVGRLAYANGVLYGVTTAGHGSDVVGTNTCFDQAGCGTVFSFALGQNPATATDTIIHSFTGMNDGAGPRAGMVLLGSVLYGTTTFGGVPDPVSGSLGCFGALGCGSIFSVDLASTPAYKNLYYFNGGENDGAAPTTELTVGGAGLLYGNTQSGGGVGCGGGGCGTVYSLHVGAAAPAGPRSTVKPVLMTCFEGALGAFPSGPLNVHRGITNNARNVHRGFGVSLAGNLTNQSTGNTGCGPGSKAAARAARAAPDAPTIEGEIFSIDLGTGNETVLSNFVQAFDPATCTTATCTGAHPDGQLVYLNGALFGSTNSGGVYDSGTIFMLPVPGS